ncbi:MAG: ABC transporter permease [Chitinophagaceae bacterium]|nr:ABC transporter permease [Chitinophagaceae bacterium]
MHKIWLIIKREYLTRVRKRSFLVTTLLIPLLMFGLIFSMIFLAARSEESQTIAVVDESGYFINKLDTVNKDYQFRYTQFAKGESNVDLMKRMDADILVRIFPFKGNHPDSVILYKEGSASLSVKEFIGGELTSIYQIKQMQDAGINKASIDSINASEISIKSFDLKNNKETHSEIASAIGYAMGFLIYMIIFIYGAGVMRGVMEEKTNRIAEVIVSSVKPFQLMMGKIIGIAFVGLTQFLLWMILMLSLQLLLPLLISDLREPMQVGMALSPDMESVQAMAENPSLSFYHAILDQNWTLIICCFLFYFLGGYLLYASMFAAVGSLVNEDPQEAQQLTIPITMPIIFGFIIMASTAKDPNSSLAVFGSLFPLTSPIVMLSRIPYGVPGWQLALSMILLIAGFILMTWLSAKIYRTGILLYGKKVTWREVFKWIRYS